MSSIKNTPFVYAAPLQNNKLGELPINSLGQLKDFIRSVDTKTIKRDKGLSNAVYGMKIIENPRSRSMPIDFMNNSEYYYKLYASLFTPEFHDYLLHFSSPFKNLRSRAMRQNIIDQKHLHSVQTSSEKATISWEKDSKQLKTMYKHLRANKNHEYIELRDDNSTLLRQAQLNHEAYLRRKYVNGYLKLSISIICLLILSGYLNEIGMHPSIVISSTIFIFVLCVVMIIRRIIKERRFNSIQFHRLKFPGYPVRNEEIQTELENIKKKNKECAAEEPYN